MEDAALPDRPQAFGPGGHGDPGHDDPGYGLERRPGGVAIDRHRERGLELTPEELVARRRNRRLLLGVVVPSIVVLGLALLATAVFWGNEPTGPSIPSPAGYKAVSDGYFAYVVPTGWATNPAFTDDAGDVDTSGPSGWAGEHRAYRGSPPTLGETPPPVLQSFGMARSEPIQLTAGHPLAVRGAATSFEYTATRAGGFHATVIDSWNARTGVEIWLMVQASPPVTDQIVASLTS